MPAIATYPGTVTPLRGLHAFAESERDVLFGRDEDREELARLVTSEGFRAGLLYGEPGVGKTSLLRAGLVPHLRDHGVITLVCEDIYNPIESFAAAVNAITSLAPAENERPITFLARVVAQALSGQQYLFIIDDVDVALATGDDRIVQELGDLFARVVTRSSGRARFLFVCASENVHHFGVLERRTGSLFPPSSRYLLERWTPEDAATVLERTLALAAISVDGQLARAVAQGLGQRGPILPADVQIAALALLELGISSADQLQRVGGAHELERLWLTNVAASTGNERSALRLVAELAYGKGTIPYTADWAATRASIDPGFARQAMARLNDKGMVRTIMLPDSPEPHFQLSHEILAPRVREVAAPARQAARRAFELLGSKAAENRRLSPREWLALRRERIAPQTGAEVAVIERTKRFFLIVGGAVAAVPLLLLIIIYISKSGSYYLDVSRPGGGSDRIVVRAGNSSLHSFDWMPASPGFGDIVADTGFTRQMVGTKHWKRARANDLDGDLEGSAYANKALSLLHPRTRGLIEYASSGADKDLVKLRKSAQGPDEMVALLEGLVPIARGANAEIALIESSLRDPSPAVQAAALQVAAATARRRPDLYGDTLAKALASPDADQRRAAFTEVRALGREKSQKLFAAALKHNPEPAARRDLLGQLSAKDESAESVASILVNRDISASEREEARTALRRSFSAEPVEASKAAAQLAADAKAPAEERVLALELLHELAPKQAYSEIVDDVKLALNAKSEVVRAAALPVYARTSPLPAAGQLATMLEDKKLSPRMRVAMALGWGEIAKTKNRRAAQAALQMQLKDRTTAVRAAAARAYGNVGSASLGKLTKMVKNEGFTVAVGAAEGLANASLAGANSHVAVGGILKLWKRKGRDRRAAVRVFARMAKRRAAYVWNYLSAATISKDDTGLHRLGAEGLCNAVAGNHRSSRRPLIAAARSKSVEVRRLVIQCAVDNPKFATTARRIAIALSRDSEASIRADAARVLASSVADGKKVPDSVANKLVWLASDSSREVRVVAVKSLAAMGESAPKKARPALTQAYKRADEREKLEILRAARDIGAAGMAEVGLADESPIVRIAAIDTAFATGANVTSAINAGLTDPDSSVRRAAIERLSKLRDKLDQATIDKALVLAIGDRDPSISELALTTLARLGATGEVIARFERAFASRSERVRAQAAAACAGLVEREPKKAEALLRPLLEDPSHDVRAAMLGSIAAAFAKSNSPDRLAKMLRGSERNAMLRLAATAAFLKLAETEAGRTAAMAKLEEIAKKGAPMVRMTARLGLGLIAGRTDGIGFLRQLVP